MKTLTKLVALSVLPLLTAGAWAEVTQDCIVEGTVNKQKARETGKDVYVSFHSASRASDDASCQLNRRGSRVVFKEPRNALIENAPDGATVQYRYTELNHQQGEWTLLNVSL
ncbi:hypothetical protein [Parahaliea aestuarii]|uniref:Uncharacterized protein n=1 Tax=Parahaliea aestuarii TaxID=1852021 RepID=A0A5C8ZQR1_9GAMM|nr:hypothetical protein [Parahaliea aestuarii]TXS90000.1 hypothetical protein FVW59_15430 [Parahaliea aestuarii]